jgi:hypothetical protein
LRTARSNEVAIVWGGQREGLFLAGSKSEGTTPIGPTSCSERFHCPIRERGKDASPSQINSNSLTNKRSDGNLASSQRTHSPQIAWSCVIGSFSQYGYFIVSYEGYLTIFSPTRASLLYTLIESPSHCSLCIEERLFRSHTVSQLLTLRV